MQTGRDIRRCAPGDEAALALVGQATFLQTFAGVLAGDAIVAHCADAHSPARYRAWLDDPDCALWLVEAEPGRAPVGYMVVAPADLPLPDPTPGDLEIKRIYLLDRWRGGGLGGQLVALAKAHAAERAARRLLLGVYAHNAAAIGFYQRAGFQALGARRFSVGGQDYDDTIMGVAIASSAPTP
jgi:ribosomal protein S18 acetylase RimI-like enzyme